MANKTHGVTLNGNTGSPTTVRERWEDNGDGTFSRLISGRGPSLPAGSQISGQVTVTSAGVSQTGPDVDTLGGVFVCALPTNSSYGWVGNDGNDAVYSTSGFPLQASNHPIFVPVANLSQLCFNVAVDGEGFAWSLV